ncbi:site-specific DNA-methyltransferase [Puia dinghuensis]|uniref:site-specific DNA-methyltransferase (adenine-specific) n=1 Tax=Puia dinghuensis TaxID=1792502 RepID=A0A8J2UK47_9BACT|nr:site-specific DNA-methyltransferase [Puia dinghuensis]GGB24900.1 site-specific DNA-methyltransferase [Puia dinghuensis]
MSTQRITPNYKFNDEQIRQLRLIAPEVFKDNILDIVTLYEALGDFIDDDILQNEHYGISWPGKQNAKKGAATPVHGTLIPVQDKSCLASGTANIFIEGENLTVLKIIKKSYANSIKAIYIDPPYNTGNDLIYEDDFSESAEDFLTRIGSIDATGKRLTTNSKADGRFHSKWLSMMYPRLKLAHQLLKEEGVICISIDDNELNNLRLIMNEIFGEENFVGNFIVQSNPRASQSSGDIGIVHEYVLVYTRNITKNAALAQRLDDRMLTEYKYTAKDGRKYRELGLRLRGGAWRRSQRQNLYFPIYVDPVTGRVSLEQKDGYTEEALPIKPTTGEEGTWRWSKEKIKKDADDLFGKQIKRGENYIWDVYQMDYLTKKDNDEKSTKPKSIWNEPEMNYQNAGEEIKELFGHSDVFDFPKPVYLIKKVLNLIDCDGEIVMDFFAGSGTTGEAIYELNSEGRNIRFILVQLDYKIAETKRAHKLGYNTIADVTSKRLELASEKYQKAEFEGSDNLLGFKYFKLGPSNYKVWKNYSGTDISNLLTLFNEQQSLLIDDWDPQSLLTEIILIEGFPLDSTIVEEESIKVNKVYKISSDSCEHSLFICLDKRVEESAIHLLPLDSSDIFICLDAAVTDQNKIRLEDRGILKTI